MHKIHSRETPSDAVLALHSDLVRRGVDLDVHADDEMFQIFYWGQGQNRDAALSMYFASGQSIWRTLEAVLTWRFGRVDNIHRMLDFAAGFGRTTRFIVEHLPSGRLWVSDIQEPAVAAQEAQFGVHGFLSAVTPDLLPDVGSFDVVTVSSLFTHLPEASFRAWLRKLGGLVTPGGVLVLSVHDPSLKGGDEQRAFIFESVSESARLSKTDYGSSWASEAFVRQAVRDELGGWSVARFPRGLVLLQDMYVLVPESAQTFSGLALPREVDGFVEHFEVDAANRLRCVGWVADRQRGLAAEAVELWIGGASAARAEGSRLVRRSDSDSGAVFGGEAVPVWGYDLQADLGAGWDGQAPVRLEVDFGGIRVELLADRLEGALLRGARVSKMFLAWQGRSDRAAFEAGMAEAKARETALEGRVEALERTIGWMEQSRFWRVRQAWWSLRRKLGLGG